MRIQADIFKVKQPANVTHVLEFEFMGVSMQVGIMMESGELFGSGFVTVKK